MTSLRQMRSLRFYKPEAEIRPCTGNTYKGSLNSFKVENHNAWLFSLTTILPLTTIIPSNLSGFHHLTIHFLPS